MKTESRLVLPFIVSTLLFSAAAAATSIHTTTTVTAEANDIFDDAVFVAHDVAQHSDTGSSSTLRLYSSTSELRVEQAPTTYIEYLESFPAFQTYFKVNVAAQASEQSFGSQPGSAPLTSAAMLASEFAPLMDRHHSNIADNRHVRMDFHFGYHFNNNGQLRLVFDRSSLPIHR